MKKTTIIVSAILLLACTVGPIVATMVYEKNRTKDLTAEILARAPEKGNFSPRKITLTAGEPAKIRIRNIDTVMHGFAVPDLKIDMGEIQAGHSKMLEFTPEKPGTYEFYCTVWCSQHHLQMRGVIEVVEK